ncbi:MAG: PAS domain S-box protein, partial [Candidatus Omnitrophica bacterium]|nr:PAS domain S-box protein [Candidatus Omnitrophota bacterium]
MNESMSPREDRPTEASIGRHGQPIQPRNVPIYLLILGFTIDFFAGYFGDTNKWGPLTVRWVTLIAMTVICASALLVFSRTIRNRHLRSLLWLGTFTLISHQFLNLLRKSEPFREYFEQGRPEFFIYLALRLTMAFSLIFLVSGLYLALISLRELYEKSLRKTDLLTKEVDARERIERELVKHQAELEEKVAERTESLEREIEERKEIERKINEESMRRTILMENSHDGIVILDHQCKVLEANRQFADMLGYTLEEVKELHAWDWDNQFSREQILEMAKMVQDGVDRFETTHRRKDGSVFNVEICSNGTQVDGDWFVLCVCRDITARKQLERDLKEREEKYRAAIETSGDGFCMVDMRGYVLEANQAYADRSGYRVEELVGKHISELDAQQSFEEIGQRIGEMRRNGNLLFETLHRAKDGSLWPVEVNVSYWPTVEGRFFAFLRDVLRRQSSEALIHARMQLSELSQKASLNELMRAALDTAERLTESQIGYFHFVEKDQENLTLQAWSSKTIETGCQIQVGEHYPISEAGVWVDCFHQRKPVIHNDYESLPHKQGLPEGHSPVIREMGVPVIRDDSVVAIIGVGNKPKDYNEDDVTILSNLAQLVIDLIERKRSEEALKASEESLRRAQEVSHTGSFTYDFKTDRFDFSEEAYRIFDLPIGSKVTSEVLESELVHPDDLQWVVEAHEHAQKAGQLNVVHRLAPQHGEKWVRICSEYERDASGFPFRAIGTIQDITELRQIQEERLELQGQLLHSQKLESLGILAGGIAHDFNNILMAILGNLDMVVSDLPPTSPAFDGVEQAIQASRRATDLTQQMLAYSGKGRFVIKRFDLSEMVTENINLFRASVAHNVSLNISLSPEELEIEADPGQIQQVIMNLLTNAVEAVGDNPGVVTLSTRLVEETPETLAESRLETLPRPGRFACLQVTDNGCGMDEETQQKLFDPFFTTKFLGR